MITTQNNKQKTINGTNNLILRIPYNKRFSGIQAS